jgi:hypothetical protein
VGVAPAIGLVAGQVYAQDKVITVRDAPIHKAPSDEAGPVEDNAPPDTLNAQYAAQSHAPAESATPIKLASATRAPQLAAPQSTPPEAAAVEAAKPAAPKPVDGPSAAISGRIIDAAGAFEAYVRKATALDGKFADNVAVSKAMAVGAAYQFEQFQEGATAYAALVALQDPAFVQGVYDLSRDPRDRADMAARLVHEPASVMDIDGAEEAAGMAGQVLARMGANLVKAGQGVKQASYDVQHQAWSKEDVAHPEQRLAQAKAVSQIKVSLNAADTDALIANIVAYRKEAGPAVRGGEPSPVVMHGLAVAALAVLGKAGDAQAEQISALLSDGKSADCMKMAKLNLYQCMAAAGPEYEDVFCLGAHAMIDTGQCLVAASGQTPIPEGSLQKASAPAVLQISVPIALMTTDGPERQRARARSAERPVPVAPPPAAAQEQEVASADPPPAPRL